jgi:hypothetical protein
MWRLVSVLMVLATTTVVAHAQGVAPGGPFYNSTGTGSGIGPMPLGGTGPTYPNGTTAPALPRAIPPGGLPPVGRIDSLPPPAPAPSTYMSRYPRQPLEPYPLPASHRKLVKDPDAGKDATDRGKDAGAPPASAL